MAEQERQTSLESSSPTPTATRVKQLLWGTLASLAAVAIGWHVAGRVGEIGAPVNPISYAEIETTFRGKSGLTEAQRREYLDSLRGAKVRWTGNVEAVDEDYTVYVDIDGLLYDVSFTLPRQTAVQLNIGQRITFVGLIDKVEAFMWTSCRVTLRDVRLD